DDASLTQFVRVSNRPAIDNVFDANRYVVDRRDHGLANAEDPPGFFAPQVVGRLPGAFRPQHRLGVSRIEPFSDQADAAHVQHVLAVDQVVAAHIGVALGDRLLQLVERDAVPHQPFRIGVDLVALDGATRADDVDDSRHAAELAFE